MIGLTNLWINGSRMEPTLDRRRALLVMDKIDEILFWEKTKEQERDVRFVELGQYLCEVRAGQYWRVDNVRSFDEFLERKFPESRRKAYYLMAIHEHLTPIRKRETRQRYIVFRIKQSVNLRAARLEQRGHLVLGYFLFPHGLAKLPRDHLLHRLCLRLFKDALFFQEIINA